MDSRLRGSADEFLSVGWTALTSLCLEGSQVMDNGLTALNLPALEVLGIRAFRLRGELLRPDQLHCPQLCSLAFQLDSSLAWSGNGSRQCCSLLSLARLTTLSINHSSPLATMDFSLPASLTRLIVQDSSINSIADLNWALLEAAKCIRGGAQLRSSTYDNLLSSPQGMPWDASSNAPYRELGEQLSGLTDLSVSGKGPTIFHAIGAIASTAPSLTRLMIFARGPIGMALPLICSASLKSITGLCWLTDLYARPQPLTMTILPACTQLRDVHVHFHDRPYEGASVKIRCHCNSQRCFVPFVRRSVLIDEVPWSQRRGKEEVGVRFMPMPASPMGVQPYTVLFTYQPAGPEQGHEWGHVIMPDVL